MNKQQLFRSLPVELQTVWRKTEKPYVRIVPQRVTSPLPAAASKFGGVPYMPQGASYPMYEGRPLYLLAQINFAEVRRAVGGMVSVDNAVLPQEGVLQIFIDGYDDLYGWDDSHPYPQENGAYQVRFYEHDRLAEDGAAADEARTVFRSLFKWAQSSAAAVSDGNALSRGLGFLKSLFPHQRAQGEPVLQLADPECSLPLYGEYALHFERDSSGVTPDDAKDGLPWWGEWLGDYCLELSGGNQAQAEEMAEGYAELTDNGSGCQLLGYPVFSQFDIRNGRSKEILLLQIGSQVSTDGWPFDMMWGDMGVGHFFITPEDLAAKRFDRLLYNWDCG